MGAFILSNKQVSADILYSRGHNKIDKISFQDINTNLIVAKKINVDNENMISFDNGDFIVGTGTFIYKKRACISALDQIYTDFNGSMLKTEIWGHYAIVIKKANTISVFVDRGGLYRVYYLNSSDGFCISSSFLSVVGAIKNPKFDPVGLAAYIDGQECSFVYGFKLLGGNEVMSIDAKGLISISLKPVLSKPSEITNPKEAVLYVKKLLLEQIENVGILAKQLNVRISSEITGGLDSRLIACVLNQSGYEYDFVNYPLNGKDKLCAELLAKSVDKEIITIDNIKIEFDDIERLYGEFDFGFNYFRHYPRKSWNFPNPIQLNGFRGEGISTYSFMDNAKKFYIKNHTSKRISSIVLKSVKEEFIKRKHLEYKKIGFNISNSLDSFEQNLYSLQIFGTEMDGNFISGQNAFNYFIAFLAEYNFYHKLSAVVNSIKKERRLAIKLIKEIDKKFASIQFCSHMVNEGQSVNDVEFVKDKTYTRWKPFIPDFILNELYGRYKSHIPLNEANGLIKMINDGKKIPQYSKFINCNKIFRYPYLYTNNLKRWASVEIIRKKFDIQF